MQFLIILGRSAIILRHDGENANKSVAKAVANAKEHDTQDECTPKYSSSSLAVDESMNREVEGQIRTMRNALEAALQMPVTIDFAVMTWMVRHAAWVLMGFEVRFDGFPACKKVKKRAYNGDVAEFCEMVMLKETGRLGEAGLPMPWTCAVGWKV